MQTAQAYALGHGAAAAGFFFDGMELVAELAPGLGGLEALREPIRLLQQEHGAVERWMAEVSSICEAAYRQPVAAPRTVDGYRTLLSSQVFDIVNRWSYIADIRVVNRLQAWFYAGFGLGRGRTVVRGLELLVALRDVAGERPPLPSVPERLRRMSAEAARQMSVAAGEDDLSGVAPLFLDASRRLDALAIGLHRPLASLVFGAVQAEDVASFEDTARKVALDLARIRA